MSLSNNFPTVSPTLNLNFAAAGRLDSRVTFTRSSTATYTNQIGLIQSAAVNEPRFDYDPSTLAARGLLIEESRTNLLTYSEQFDNAAWTKTNATVTANAAVAPDGATTADLLLDNTTNDIHRIYNSFSATSGAAYTMSLFIKAGTSTRNVGMLFGSGFGEKAAIFNPATGAVVSFTSGVTASIQALSNGWYRAIMTATSDANTVASAQIYICESAAVAYVGNGTGHYIWGAQCE